METNEYKMEIKIDFASEIFVCLFVVVMFQHNALYTICCCCVLFNKRRRRVFCSNSSTQQKKTNV